MLKLLRILPREFYSRDTVKVAKDLLGKRVIRKIGGTELSGLITETEAYRHTDDPASHAFKKMTERNKAMFGEVGRAYVYFTYGMYFCFNIVAKKPGVSAGAVLIRGIHPDRGINLMKKNRKILDNKNIANGPAKITQAFRITHEHYGIDLTKNSELHVAEGVQLRKKILSQPRIGIHQATERRWNFTTREF